MRRSSIDHEEEEVVSGRGEEKRWSAEGKEKERSDGDPGTREITEPFFPFHQALHAFISARIQK